MGKSTKSQFNITIDRILVDYAELHNRSETATQRWNSFENELKAIKKMVDASINYWTGLAGDEYRKVFEIEYKHCVETINKMRSYSDQLEKYAGEYEVVEQSATAIAQDINTIVLE